MIVGVDYGSRKAGTTVICYPDQNKLSFRQSVKNQDADILIQTFVFDFPVSLMAIDAPLSLPGVYSVPEGNYQDYHYRRSDREAGAMSPLFLGGLTARAMELVHRLQSSTEIIEVYPRLLAEEFQLQEVGYKKDKSTLNECTNILLDRFELKLTENPQNWHQVDSLLAYISGMRFSKNEAQALGDEEEGLIYF